MENQWDAQKMLDLYIYDYLQRKNMQTSADSFIEETGLVPTEVCVAPPDGFLMQWWSFFWDMYCSRMNQSPMEIGESSSQENITAADLMGFIRSNELQPFQAANTVQAIVGSPSSPGSACSGTNF